MINNKQIEDKSYDSILREVSKKSSKTFSLSKTYPAFIVLIIALALSFLIFKFADRYVKNDNNSNFDKAISSVISRVNTKYQENIQVSNSLSELFKDRKNNVPWQVYDLYASVPAKTLPSILSVIYAPRITKNDYASFIHLAWSQNWGYTIKPEGSRALYYPAYYIVPFSKINLRLSGYDFWTNSEIQNSIDESVKSKDDKSTPLVNFRNSDTLSLFIISPLFEIDSITGNNKIDSPLNGVLLLELNAKTFVYEALKNQVPTDTSIVFDCSYSDKDNKQINIYNSTNSKQYSSDYKNITATKCFKIYNHNLVFNFKTIPDFGGSFKSILPLLSLIIALILSIALFGFLLSVMTSRAVAVDIADRMTRSQRRIVDSSQDIIAVLDFDGNWKSMNSASFNILGISANDLISNKIDNLFYDKSEFDKFYTLSEKDTNEWTERIDLRMKSKNGELKWINWNFTFSKLDALIYCIGRDVTLEKIAEEQTMLKTKQIQLAEQFTREVSESKSLFMTKLSHQFRNSLTSIIGYLQLLSGKLYDNEEEHDSYIELVQTDTEELFTYVSDMVDVALGKDESSFQKLKNSELAQVITEAQYQLYEDYPLKKSVYVECDEQVNEIIVACDIPQLISALEGVFYSLSEPSNDSIIKISVIENPYASAIDIQITSNANPFVSRLIDLYKNNINSLIDILQDDKNDVIMQLALASSRIRMLNGAIIVDTFGEHEDIVIQIEIPLNKS